MRNVNKIEFRLFLARFYKFEKNFGEWFYKKKFKKGVISNCPFFLKLTVNLK